MSSDSKKTKEKKTKKGILTKEKRTIKSKPSIVKVPAKVHSIVQTLRKGRKIERQGRGFSLYELRQAGLSIAQARKLGLRIDPRRKTEYQQNIKHIKSTITRSATAA
ncbi:MAG: ribosomal protein L13e [Conexivisphaerales archaeon]